MNILVNLEEMSRLELKDILKLVKSHTDITDEDRTTMYVIAKFLENEKFKASLSGAYSLYINSFHYFGESRVRKTIDADFSTRLKENVETYLDSWSKKCGFKIEGMKTTRASNLKFKIVSPVINRNLQKTGNFIKVQVDLNIGDDESEQGVASPKEVMVNKSNLKLTVVDRRLKDLVDFIINIDAYYPDGISKSELIDMVYAENKRELAEISTIENIQDCLRQAEKFSFSSASKISKQECVTWFFNIINGLIDRGIPDSYVFFRGDWYPPK